MIASIKKKLGLLKEKERNGFPNKISSSLRDTTYIEKVHIGGCFFIEPYLEIHGTLSRENELSTLYQK